MDYNLQPDKLCAALELGRLLEEPAALTGGHLHRMYSVVTDRGRYAVKALNPGVMLRPPALPAIRRAEQTAVIAAGSIPALPALIINGSAVQLLDGQYYMVFDWLDGRSLLNSEITAGHCAVMGSLLAKLHRMDFGTLYESETPAEKQPVNWQYYLNLGKDAGAVWTEELRGSASQLDLWSRKLVAAAKALDATVVSHGDLEPKNVLWADGAPVIIDWESAGRMNPAHDLMETAIYWAKDAAGDVQKDRFLAFIRAYEDIAGRVEAAWNTVLAKGFSSMSGWLEYSLKRSLGIEFADEEERQLGTEQVFGTLDAAQRYFEAAPVLLEWLGAR
jgi:Ser/Thr protein kinase RdoA (MazF antagonist)